MIMKEAKQEQLIYNNYELFFRNDLNIKPLVVCKDSAKQNIVFKEIKKKYPDLVIFNKYSSNPKYEEIVDGIEEYKKNKCNFLISIGGGSSIDVAKTIKAFLNLDNKENYLNQKIIPNDIKHLAVPTTAGTGSESTYFAVIYYNHEKKSISDKSLLPDYVILEASCLKGLPSYQKKSTLLDALCQAIESYYSVNSTSESQEYAKKAIKIILDNYKKYIDEDENTYSKMLEASNLSGKAICISKTTAAHAMSYKITSLYNIPHGYAVALCFPHIWEYMNNNLEKTIDPRGKEYVKNTFKEICMLFNVNSYEEVYKEFIEILNTLDLPITGIIKEKDLELLTNSVNVERLKNNPISLNEQTINEIYKKLL